MFVSPRGLTENSIKKLFQLIIPAFILHWVSKYITLKLDVLVSTKCTIHYYLNYGPKPKWKTDCVIRTTGRSTLSRITIATTRHQSGKINLPHLGRNPVHVPYWRVSNPTFRQFCFAMMGRASKIKKRRRYEYLAATSQLSMWSLF